MFGNHLDCLLRHACSSTMHFGTARYQPPLGNSFQIYHPLAYMKVDLNDLLSFIWFLLLQCAAQNSPFFPLLIRKSLAPSFCLCNVFLNFPETATAMLRQNLKNWKLYSKEGNTATYGIRICPVFFFSPVNPNICHFSFLLLHLMSTELVSSLISKVWVRIFLSAAD